MKYIVSLCFFFYATASFAQKQFEGIITYKLHFDNESSEPELKVYFGKNALRLIMKEKDRAEEQELLVNLDSGYLYTVNVSTKQYRVKKLTSNEPIAEGPAEKSIAGYKARATAISSYPIQQIIGLLGGANAQIYTSDELQYTIPARYAGNPELAMIADNKIILSITGRSKKYSEVNNPAFSGEAVTVSSQVLPAANFILPEDYVLEKEEVYDAPISDSAALADPMATDTSISITIEDIPQKDKVAPPPPPRKPVKKKTKPATSPARKPE